MIAKAPPRIRFISLPSLSSIPHASLSAARDSVVLHKRQYVQREPGKSCVILHRITSSRRQAVFFQFTFQLENAVRATLGERVMLVCRAASPSGGLLRRSVVYPGRNRHRQWGQFFERLFSRF